ncbi:hypothetical protein [Actinoplanes sp. NPDC051851]|uniref:hypothetical protein n=1 Tax=Actinoplanes sp. NPDC051851 TaxID=3154753 RepID=UPI003412142E
MEALSSVSSLAPGGQRGPGWQQQLRVDYVVNKVMQTHRGQQEAQVKQALTDQMRAFGVMANGRLMAQYAAAISSLPELPPNNKN